MNRRTATFLTVGILALGIGGAGITRAAVQQQAATGPVAGNYTVTAGWGDKLGVANIFTPQTLEIYVGDTVTWKIGGSLEPHTITFGPSALLGKLANGFVAPVPQKAGPPIIALNSQAAFPTHGTTYGGTGFANSGLLDGKGKTWSLTFTKPGTYHYYCLVHYDPSPGGEKMGGTIIVHPRPTASHVYNVSMGSAQDTALSAADGFFPRHLTIHAGDTVVWTGFFHTVTFGPQAERDQLQKELIVPVPQKNGPPILTFNPKIVYPSGGNTFDGVHFVNSGLLQGNGPQPPQFKLTFTKPGTYEYDCMIHSSMDGTITVLPAGQ